MATRKPPRQMAAKACERCRKRKIKCDEFFPCGTCTRMRVVCKVEDPSERRRDHQQSALEDRIKRLEAMLVATYTNPNNHIVDMNMPGMDQEAFLSNPTIGVRGPSSPGGRLKPPLLTLQTPSTPGYQQPTDFEELLSAPGGYAQSFPSWSPPPSQPPSATEYFSPSDMPPWSTNAFTAEPASLHQESQGRGRSRAASLCPSDTSIQDEYLSSPSQDRNRFSIDTSQSTLDIPQIEVTSWDRSRPQSPAPLSPGSGMDIDMSWYCPPELSVGTWSGPSTPSIAAPSYLSERDNLSVANRSLPSHSRRSSINSLSADYDAYGDGKNPRRRSASDVFPIAQQSFWPEQVQDFSELLSENTTGTTTPHMQQRNLPEFHPPHELPSESYVTMNANPTDELYTQIFNNVIHPLFPISPSISLQQSPSLIKPHLTQTHTHLLRALSSHVLSQRHPQSSQLTQLSHHYYSLASRSFGGGSWDSLAGIQCGILMGIYLLLTGSLEKNLYVLNGCVVSGCLDLGLHRDNSGTTQGSLEADTLVAAYVFDNTVAIVRERPRLLKDADLEAGMKEVVKRSLVEKAESGSVRRCEEGGRLWDWWARFEETVRNRDQSVPQLQRQGSSGLGIS